MKRVFKIPLVVMFISGVVMFSKGVTAGYLIAYLHSVGFEDWIAGLSIFIIRSSAIYFAGKIKSYSLDQREGRHLISLISLISVVGYLLILQIDNYYIAIITCILLASTTLSQIMLSSIIIEEINTVVSKKDFPRVFSGFDVIKMLVSLVFSGLLAGIIFLWGLNVGIVVMAAISLLVFAINYNTEIGLSRLKLTRVGADNSGVDVLSQMSYVIPISWSIMVINVWLAIVPTLMVLSDFNLGADWVAILMFVESFGFGLAFLFPMAIRFISMKKLCVLISINSIIGIIIILSASNIGIFLVGSFLIAVSVGGFFALISIYVNLCDGNTHRKVSSYYYKVNYYQPFAYLLVPFSMKFNAEDIVISIAVMALLVTTIAFYRYDSVVD